MQVLGAYFIWLNFSNAGLGGQYPLLVTEFLKKTMDYHQVYGWDVSCSPCIKSIPG